MHAAPNTLNAPLQTDDRPTEEQMKEAVDADGTILITGKSKSEDKVDVAQG